MVREFPPVTETVWRDFFGGQQSSRLVLCYIDGIRGLSRFTDIHNENCALSTIIIISSLVSINTRGCSLHIALQVTI